MAVKSCDCKPWLPLLACLSIYDFHTTTFPSFIKCIPFSGWTWGGLASGNNHMNSVWVPTLDEQLTSTILGNEHQDPWSGRREGFWCQFCFVIWANHSLTPLGHCGYKWKESISNLCKQNIGIYWKHPEHLINPRGVINWTQSHRGLDLETRKLSEWRGKVKSITLSRADVNSTWMQVPWPAQSNAHSSVVF